MCGWCGTPVGGGLEGAEHVEDDLTAVVGPEAEVSSGADAYPPTALPAGTELVGRYRIDAVLGRGGFGITYRADDLRLDRSVAIKELFPLTAHRRGLEVTVAAPDVDGFEAARVRFGREAAALARFNHPGIVRVFEVLELNGTAYLIMELIEGTSMGELLASRGEPLGVDEALEVVVRVGRALRAVHEAGLLHRDINPSNIMLDPSRRIVLIDFGLARRFGDDISGALTRAVTPGYAPPEQYAGSARSGPPCDVFGLAATAYKLLTGVTPTNVFDRQAGIRLPAPADLRREVPALVSAGNTRRDGARSGPSPGHGRRLRGPTRSARRTGHVPGPPRVSCGRCRTRRRPGGRGGVADSGARTIRGGSPRRRGAAGRPTSAHRATPTRRVRPLARRQPTRDRTR